MRNLKRVLSLALALVMVLGMMVITTSAATYTDAEEITYTEAVDVVSAIGVLNGFEAADGTFTFKPTEVLTREQAAKMICYLMMGKTNADKLVGSGTFTDVAADRWSAGAIDYCASLGILAGNGDGTFNPTGKLTAVAYGKMLLCALGYDAAIEGYVNNANWATAIATDMIDVGLDVYGVDLDAQLTREQAAEMTLYALQSDMVEYETKGTSITVGGVEIVSGASQAKASDDVVKAGTPATEVNYYGGTDGVLQLCEKYAGNLKMDAGVGDDFGRPSAYRWYIEKDNVDGFNALKDVSIINVMYPASYTVDVTSVKNDTLAEIAEAMDLTLSVSDASYKIGDTVELYVSRTGAIWDTVVLHTELAQIAKVTKTTDKDAKYTYDVAVKGETGIANYTDKTLIGFDFDTMTKDTYVTLVKGTNTAIIALADKVTGKQTATGTGYIKVEGEKMEYAGDNWVIDAVNYTDTFDFYVDAKGYIIGTEKVAAAKVPTTVFYVSAGNFSAATSFEAAKAQLAVINLDGSKEVVNMAISKAGKVTVNGTATALASGIVPAGFYKYTVDENGDIATVTAVNYNVASPSVKGFVYLYDGQSAVFTEGKAKVQWWGDTFYATEATTLTTITNKVTTIVGYKNFADKTFTAGSGVVALAEFDGTTLKAVYVIGADASVLADDAVYGWHVSTGDKTYNAQKDKYYTEVIYNVAGENVAYTIEGDSVVTGLASIVVTDGIAALSSAGTVNKVFKTVTNSYVIEYGASDVTYLADKVAIYDVTNVNKNGVVAIDEIPADSVVTYTTNVQGKITAVYVTYAAQTDGVLTTKNATYLEKVLGFSAADAAAAAADTNADWVVVQFTRPANTTTTKFIIKNATTGAVVKTYTSSETTAGVRGVMADPNGTAGSYTFTVECDDVVVCAGSFVVE